MKIKEMALQNEINTYYKRLASEVVAYAIKDYDLALRHYLLTGNIVVKFKTQYIYLKEVTNFILSPYFELYSVSNLNGDIILIELTKRIGGEILAQNKHRKEVVERYDYFKSKLDKAIAYKNLVGG